MGYKHPDQLSKKCVNFVSQNTRGFNVNKEEELIDCWQKNKVYAGCIQETWRTGKESWENGGFVFIHNGLAKKPCSRGAQGVAIVLGPEARQAWEKAGSQQICIGHRIVAARL